MRTSRKAGLVIVFVVAMSVFGYSQYASASQIEVSIAESQLLGEDERGSEYGVELEFHNPSLLRLTAGETEFFVISDDEIIGKGQLESFTLQPMDSSYAKGTFHTDSGEESESLRISGVTKYDLYFTTVDVPFVYYPTEDEAREFIHQG